MSIAMSKKRDYAAVFIESAAVVFQHELATSLKKRAVSIKSNSKPVFPLSIIIGFVASSFKGQVVYSMGKDMGEAIVRRMAPGLLPVQQKEMIYSCLGELANMISGKASVIMAGTEEMIDITPPLVAINETKFDFLAVPTIVLTLDSTLGAFTIGIAFQER